MSFNDTKYAFIEFGENHSNQLPTTNKKYVYINELKSFNKKKNTRTHTQTHTRNAQNRFR